LKFDEDIIVKKMTPSSEFMNNIEIENKILAVNSLLCWRRIFFSVLNCEFFSKFWQIWWRERELGTNGLRPK